MLIAFSLNVCPKAQCEITWKELGNNTQKSYRKRDDHKQFSVPVNEEEQILGEVAKPGLNPEKIYSLSFEDRRRETARALSIICDVVIYSSSSQSVKNGSFRSCMTVDRKFQ